MGEAHKKLPRVTIIGLPRFQTMINHHGPQYHQMLVSPHIGGGEKVAFEIHKYAAASRGPVSQLLIPSGGEAARFAIDAGFPFIEYKLDWLVSSSPFQSLVENCQLFLRTAKHRHGLIHIHSPFVYGAASPFLRLSRLKTVLHIHLDYTEDQLTWCLRFPPDLIFVCAEFIRPTVENTLSRVKTKASRVRVLLNAVDNERFVPSDHMQAKARLGIDPEVPLIIMVANLAPHKGQETAIRSVELLQGKGQAVKLWLIGAERERGENYLIYLKTLSGQLGVSDSVTFLGFRNDVPDVLSAADFLLLPSTSEGLPLSILEAQASGVIVLAAPTAGIPEVINDGRTGYLIPSDDYQGYAAKIAFLLANRSCMDSIREAAYKQVRDTLSMKKYCSTVLEEYDNILKVS